MCVYVTPVNYNLVLIVFIIKVQFTMWVFVYVKKLMFVAILPIYRVSSLHTTHRFTSSLWGCFTYLPNLKCIPRISQRLLSVSQLINNKIVWQHKNDGRPIDAWNKRLLRSIKYILINRVNAAEFPSISLSTLLRFQNVSSKIRNRNNVRM